MVLTNLMNSTNPRTMNSTNPRTMTSKTGIKWTTISLRQKTRDELASYGVMGNSFEDVVQKLLQSWRENFD